MAVKLYKSREWLYKKYKVEKLTLAEIAKLCGCSEMTISNYVKEYKLK